MLRVRDIIAMFAVALERSLSNVNVLEIPSSVDERQEFLYKMYNSEPRERQACLWVVQASTAILYNLLLKCETNAPILIALEVLLLVPSRHECVLVGSGGCGSREWEGSS